MTEKNMLRWLCAATLACASAPARAEQGQGAAAAQALYDEGRRLVREGHAAEACPKLEESNRIDPAVGTRFYLADCYERTGRIASAWSIFLEVASASKVRGHQEREDLARQRASALEPRLARLRLTVASPAAGQTVKLDDLSVGRAAWGTAMPIDPGEHVIVAAAPGRKAWTTKMTVIGEGSTASIDVPLLEVAPESAAAEPMETGRGQRVWGLVLGGVGLAGIGVGTVFGVRALSKNDDSRALCDGNACLPEGKELRDEAGTNAWVANIALAVGGLTALAGAYLFLSAPSSRSATHVKVGVGSVTLGGTF